MSVDQSHKLVCTEEEGKQTACLNGGVCFAVPGTGSREIACQCTEGWDGKRCETLDQFIVINSSMVIGVVAAIIFLAAVVMIIVILLLRKRRRRQQQQMQHATTNNTQTAQSLLHQT